MSGAPPSAPASRVGFPEHEELARKFFGEAVRHLEDARVLHEARRYPGAIASSQKAAELATKAVLILEGSLGWWDQLQQTHKPLESIRSHPVLKQHFEELQAHDPVMLADLMALEKLAPARPDAKNFDREGRVNPEYPFFYLETSAGGSLTAHLKSPSEHFQRTDSEKSYLAAHQLLQAYQTLRVGVRAWGHSPPDPV